jgi:hypothetical protein
MPHDSSKVLLGSTVSSSKDISVHNSDPANFVAGVAVRQKSDGELSLLVGDGQLVGVSLGRSLSDHKKTQVCRAGLAVPMRLEAEPARGTVVITSYANLVSGTDDAIAVGATSFVAQAGSATPGQATFQAATSDEATATSLAAQINAHATAGALVEAVADGDEVLITAKSNTTAGNDIVLTYTDNDSNIGATVTGSGTLTGGGGDPDWVAVGEKVYISDVTGKADDPNSASTVCDAVYISGVLTGIDEDGNEVACALVDMPGGL